jgi:hypothetical protein
MKTDSFALGHDEGENDLPNKFGNHGVDFKSIIRDYSSDIRLKILWNWSTL